jgi:hypothetical protein
MEHPRHSFALFELWWRAALNPTKLVANGFAIASQ